MPNIKTRTLALLTSLSLTAASLSACGSKPDTTGPAETSAATTTTAATTAATTTTAAETTAATTAAEPEPAAESTGGSPWATSVESGQLPAEIPDRKDDLYTYYNYDFLKEYQDNTVTKSEMFAGELTDTVLAAIKDTSRKDHCLDQVRILFDQAADIDTLKEQGITELQPYLDMIAGAASIDELNSVLTSEDFPFSPIFTFTLETNDTREDNDIAISPNCYFCDALTCGGVYYTDVGADTLDLIIMDMSSHTYADAALIGMTQEETEAAMQALLTFEKEYGKEISYAGKYNSAEYGTDAKISAESHYSLDEVIGICPNIPIKGILENCGKAGSDEYTVLEKEWLAALNDLWTEDNLDTIKFWAEMKILNETFNYRDPSGYYELTAEYDPSGGEIDPDAFAFSSCNSIGTFGALFGELYVDDVIGEKGEERLKKLTQDIIDEYKVIIADTEWLDDESEKKALEKLDNMTLNVLRPVDGYFDYSKLKLTPSDKGGTLIGNYLKLKQFRNKCESKLINKPAVKCSTWYCINPTVSNCYFDYTSNSINIFPGYITSDVYGSDMDDSELYARIGFTIAHEVSHAFDFANTQFDAYGNPNMILNDEDISDYLERCDKLADYFSSIVIEPGINVDGQLVKGEAVADLSGMQAIFCLADKNKDFDLDKFFDCLSDYWAEIFEPMYLQFYVEDVHPLNNLRINVNAQMLSQTYEAFGIKEGDGMYLAPEDRIIIWGKSS